MSVCALDLRDSLPDLRYHMASLMTTWYMDLVILDQAHITSYGEILKLSPCWSGSVRGSLLSTLPIARLCLEDAL